MSLKHRLLGFQFSKTVFTHFSFGINTRNALFRNLIDRNAPELLINCWKCPGTLQKMIEMPRFCFLRSLKHKIAKNIVYELDVSTNQISFFGIVFTGRENN